MQYTIRGIPPNVDRALRERAARERKSLNEVAVEMLLRALGLDAVSTPLRSLDDVEGSWVSEPEVDAALDAQRVVDSEMWK